MSTIVIDSRFHGIDNVALGGYVGGILARDLKSAEVTLRRPVPTGQPVRMERGKDGAARLSSGTELLASIQPAKISLDVPNPVTFDEALAASAHYPGLRKHVFPTCFTCGPDRSESDGLRIFAGPVPNRTLVAAPWTPHSFLADSQGHVRAEFIWAALDCPSIWAYVLQSPPDSEERVVTARFGVEELFTVLAEEPQIVIGWKAGQDGRFKIAGSAVYSAEGMLLATAKHTLASTSWGVPLGMNHWGGEEGHDQESAKA